MVLHLVMIVEMSRLWRLFYVLLLGDRCSWWRYLLLAFRRDRSLMVFYICFHSCYVTIPSIKISPLQKQWEVV
ncbi:hypothetical protein EUGRSUZ_F00447 [Eucalyptus grandis]|uniref:Uncharacterized protein n=2 Tax=Eucalyptus grandis TaxID=71139 RepID=A0ACC3KBL3_EUCGR|nr:hypothetical protein EUGRSUZ_F00447 [Eucalyptus grandis]